MAAETPPVGVTFAEIVEEPSAVEATFAVYCPFDVYDAAVTVLPTSEDEKETAAESRSSALLFASNSDNVTVTESSVVEVTLETVSVDLVTSTAPGTTLMLNRLSSHPDLTATISPVPRVVDSM